MIRPDALPIHALRSHVLLAPDAVRLLFGKKYTLRGTEHVLVSRGAGAEVRLPVSAGPSRLVLDALDRDSLRGDSPLRLRGPAGSVMAPPAERTQRALHLPTGLIGAWGLKPDQRVVVQTGTVAFADVCVVPGEAGVWLDRADLLAAGVDPGDHAQWTPDITLSVSKPPPDDTPTLRPTGRLITENDVRQARLRGQHIIAGPDHVVTPAARSLGRELGVLRTP